MDDIEHAQEREQKDRALCLAIACTTCANRTNPGRSDAGYCAMRPDLPLAYGAGHPLRQLPTDNGATCAMWMVSE